MSEEQIPSWLEWYLFVVKNWKFGENRRTPMGTDMGPMKCPDCEATEFTVEPDGYEGVFHTKQHNLRARCLKCNATLAIAVLPILINSFGSEWNERGRVAKKSRGSH